MALLAAMSVIVGGDVFWQLRSIGTALAPPGDQIAAEDPQLSNELGLKRKLESVSDWELSLPSDFTGTRREYAAAIAESQLGYTATDGYTRYGDWFGSPYGEWNIAFVHFVMHYAGVAGYEIPYASSCASWFRNLQSKDLLLTADSGFPERGDVLLTDLDADGVADRAGIIAETADQSQVTVIEGNLEGAVGQTSYAWDDACICGWVSLAEPDADAEMAASAEDAGTFSDGIEYLSFEAVSESGITVSAKAVPDVFPDGTAMTVHDLPKKDAVMAAEQQFAADMQLLDAVAVDITFTDAEGNELEPAGNAGVEVELKLPPEQQLEGSVFSLLHLTDDGAAEEIPDASVNSEGASFTAESFSVYVVTGGNESGIEVGVGTDIGTSADNPYIIYVGETIRLIGRSNVQNEDCYLYLDNQSQSVLQPQGNNWIRNEREGNLFVTERDYKGIAAGSATVSLRNDSANGQYDNFYVQVKDEQRPSVICVELGEQFTAEAVVANDASGNHFQTWNNNGIVTPSIYGDIASIDQITPLDGDRDIHTATFTAQQLGQFTLRDPNGKETTVVVVPKHIYVETNLDPRDIDRVNEALPSNFNWTPMVDGYIPNSVDNRGNGNYIIYPYYMYKDVPATFFTNESAGEDITYTVERLETTPTNYYGLDCVNINGEYQANPSQFTMEARDEDGKAKIECTASQAGYYRITAMNNGVPFRSFYVYCRDEANLNHSDMEIADGGKYTFTEITVNDDGSVTTVIKQYDAAVSSVNSCNLYDSTDDQTKQKVKRTDTETETDVEFKTEHYVPLDGGVGNTQYEWTSNPFVVQAVNGSAEFQWFDGSQVKQVVFDVDLELKPVKIKTIQSKGGNIISESAWENWSATTETRENVIYVMDQQDIIDAFNKCPNHSGFDFTARSNAAVLSFEAKKELSSHRTLEAGQYSFEIVDLDNLNDNDQPTVIRTATNQLNPKKANDYSYVLFDNIRFEHPGVYHYAIREVIPADADENMLYDKQTYPVTVEIREGDNGMLYGVLLGDVPKERVFTNCEKYQLPATGGIGVWPYMFGGITIISMACFVLLETKKKFNADNFK